jgi:hypothetical protein
VTTGREEVGSEASTRARSVAAAAIAAGCLLIGAAIAVADTQPPPPPPPPPDTGGGGAGSTTVQTTTQTAPRDTTPPPRVHGLRVDVSTPGRTVLTWTLVHRADIASVFVLRGPAGRCPTHQPLQPSAKRVGDVTPRTRQVDKRERDGKRYCYAVYTLDKAGNWASPVVAHVRNKGDTTAPDPVADVSTTTTRSGVHVAWTPPPDAAQILVIRGRGAACPGTPATGTRIGGRSVRSSQVDATADTTTAHCYSVFALDQAGNRSPGTTAHAKANVAPSGVSGAATAARQSSSSSSALPTIVAILGGGALVLAGLAFATLRIVRREWEWHTRTGYGIRDLMSVDVHDYSPLALVIPAVLGVCIAGAVVALLLSL